MGERPNPQRDPASSMALIFDAMRHPLDPSYAEAAKRRAPGENQQLRGPLLFVTLVLLGLLLSAGATQLRQPKSVVEKRHQELVGQVEAAQKRSDDNAKTATGLRKDVAALQEAALARTDADTVKAKLAQQNEAAGGTDVSGDGITLTIDNPTKDGEGADSDPRTAGNVDSVSSTDLQQIVNELFRAGATDIEINDQRLSSLSAIRFAGSAILVNYRPLATPYSIKAIGPSSMQSAFEGGYGGRYLETMKKGGFAVSLKAGKLTLRAAPALTLSHAQAKR